LTSYSIKSLTLEGDGLQITKESFETIKDSRNRLAWLLAYHEDYESVVDNYYDAEQELLSITISQVIRTSSARVVLDEYRRRMSRRISNFLESAESFKNRTITGATQVFGRGSPQSKFAKDTFELATSHSLECSLMDALRNHSQHSQPPIHGMSYSGKWEDIEIPNKARRVHSTEPKLNLKRLSLDRKCKSAADAARQKHGDDMPLMPLVREYLSSLSAIMARLDQRFDDQKQSWLSILDDALSKCENFLPGCQRSSLEARAEDETGKRVDDVYLGAEWSARIAQRTKDFKPLVNLSRVEFSSLRKEKT
jgi:hypothetical protein